MQLQNIFAAGAGHITSAVRVAAKDGAAIFARACTGGTAMWARRAAVEEFRTDGWDREGTAFAHALGVHRVRGNGEIDAGFRFEAIAHEVGVLRFVAVAKEEDLARGVGDFVPIVVVHFHYGVRELIEVYAAAFICLMDAQAAFRD